MSNCNLGEGERKEDDMEVERRRRVLKYVHSCKKQTVTIHSVMFYL